MKMKPYKTVDEYLENFSGETLEILKKIRKIIREILPKAEEAISYGIPTFKIDGKYVVYFAGYEKHVSLYPVPHVPESFKSKIAPYIAGKGTIKFELNKPIPFDLVTEIVTYALATHKERIQMK